MSVSLLTFRPCLTYTGANIVGSSWAIPFWGTYSGLETSFSPYTKPSSFKHVHQAELCQNVTFHQNLNCLGNVTYVCSHVLCLPLFFTFFPTPPSSLLPVKTVTACVLQNGQVLILAKFNIVKNVVYL